MMKKRPFWGICFITEGSIAYKSKGAEIIAESGYAVILKKDSLYNAECIKSRTKDILINFCSGISEVVGASGITLIKGCNGLREDFFEISSAASKGARLHGEIGFLPHSRLSDRIRRRNRTVGKNQADNRLRHFGA